MDYAENRLDRDSSVAHPPVLLALRHGRNSEALTIAVTTLVAAIEISPLPTAVHDLIGDVCQALEFVALPELSVRLLSAIYDFTRPHDPANIPAADTIHAALSKSFPDLLQPLPPSSCVPLSPPPLLSTLFLKQSYAQSHPPLSILSTPLSLVANSAALHLPQYSDFYCPPPHLSPPPPPASHPYNLNNRPEAHPKSIHAANKLHLAVSHKSHNAYYHFIYCLANGRGRQKRPPPLHKMENEHIPMRRLYPTLPPALPPPFTQYLTPPPLFPARPDTIFYIGDSHTLSLAHVSLPLPTPLQVIPAVCTGLKASHVRATSSSSFFTVANLTLILSRLPAAATTVLFSCGEIDCREGIGGPVYQQYTISNDEALWSEIKAMIEARVRSYLTSLVALFHEHAPHVQEILVMPVLPHARRSKDSGRAAAREPRRRTIFAFNSALKAVCSMSEELLLVDCFENVADEDGCLKKEYDCDGTHANNAIRGHVARAIMNTTCRLID